jgi:hypothetical protein
MLTNEFPTSYSLVIYQYDSRGQKGDRPGPYAPSLQKSHLAAHGDCKKALLSVIVQIKTGMIGLNSYMYGIRPDKAPTDRCLGSPTQRETIYHVLINCPSYRMDRRKYWTEGTPHSLGEIFTDTQKTATAAKLNTVTNPARSSWQGEKNLTGCNREDA